MMKYLVNITSFDGLKKLYREWAMKLHPDMGGSDAEMQVLNNEYDVLFAVWKNRKEVETGVHTEETADGDRRWFYTQNAAGGCSLYRTAEVQRKSQKSSALI